MKVLVACEFSGTVRRAFAERGHDAWSCDLLPADDGSLNHLQCDATEVINMGWDLMICHPPCTFLSVSGMHWTTRGLRDPKLTEDALAFVRTLLDAPIERIALENPVSVISTKIRKPTQTIQPWWFGDDASKKTCLWLKGLKPLSIQDKSLVAPLGFGRLLSLQMKWLSVKIVVRRGVRHATRIIMSVCASAQRKMNAPIAPWTASCLPRVWNLHPR